MERNDARIYKEHKLLKSTAASLLLGEELKGFHEAFESEIKKINSPNFRKAETTVERDLVRLRRRLLAEPILFAYQGYDIKMYGHRDGKKNLVPYLQLADLRIYPAEYNTDAGGAALLYNLWHRGIFIGCSLKEPTLARRLDELYRTNRQAYSHVNNQQP